MKYIIDRFEEGIAVCETEHGEMINIKISTLPKNIQEGTLLIKTEKGYIIDKDKEKTQKSKIKALEDELYQ